jgi:hypothetical protein
VALSLAGTGAVERLLALLGPADPSVARDEAPASLRARFGTSSRHNACHGCAPPAAPTGHSERWIIYCLMQGGEALGDEERRARRGARVFAPHV